MLPLFDKRILITRTREQASDLGVQLEALGATPILIPTIEIVAPESFAPLDKAILKLFAPEGESFDWLIFTSVNAVEVFRERRATLGHVYGSIGSNASDVKPQLEAAPSISPLLRTKVAVIGPATARAANAAGLSVDLMPTQYVAESLAEALSPLVSARSVLLLRATDARDVLPEVLTLAGAHVTIANAYRTQAPSDSIAALKSLFSSSPHYPHAITFTSASTARHLFDLLEAAHVILPPGITLASIGPITSQALRDLGHPATVEAAMPTIPSLIDALVAHFQQHY